MTPETLEGIRRRNNEYMRMTQQQCDKYFPTGKSILAAEDRHDLLEYIDELERREKPAPDQSVQNLRDPGSKGEE